MEWIVHDERALYESEWVSLAIADVDMKSDLAPIVAADPAIRFAVNGGFFGQKTEPVGLVEVGKKRLSGFSRPMSGGVLSIDDGKGTLTSTESYNSDEHHAFAIQCKPRLVVGGAVNIRGDDGKRAERTAIAGVVKGQLAAFAKRDARLAFSFASPELQRQFDRLAGVPPAGEFLVAAPFGDRLADVHGQGVFQEGEHVEQGGLARTVGAHQHAQALDVGQARFSEQAEVPDFNGFNLHESIPWSDGLWPLESTGQKRF